MTNPMLHYPGAEDCAFLDVRSQQLATLRMRRAIAAKQPIAFSGEPGVGKTTTLHRVLEGQDRLCVVTEIPYGASPRQFLDLTVEAFTGSIPSPRTCILSLQRQLAELCLSTDVVIAIDEAQNLSDHHVAHLGWVFNKVRKLPVILLGYQLKERLEDAKHLKSRMKSVTEIKPLSAPQAVKALNDLHPIFAATADNILVKLNTDFCTGNLRRMAQAAATGIELGLTSITEDSYRGFLGALT